MDARFFESTVNFWFEDNLAEKVQFLNKFYQCFLMNQLIHKTRKLVLNGVRDSGKTSFREVFKGLLNYDKIAMVTEEEKFGLSMIKEDTELLYIDEWADKTLSASLAKILLQGGMFPQSVKFHNGQIQVMNGGIFITCNGLPDFGKDQENVERRLAIFQTKELPQLFPEAPEWMKNNAMSCLVWTINVINSNKHLIPKEELFYELPADELSTLSRFQDRMDPVELQKIIDCEIVEQEELVEEAESSNDVFKIGDKRPG